MHVCFVVLRNDVISCAGLSIAKRDRSTHKQQHSSASAAKQHGSARGQHTTRDGEPYVAVAAGPGAAGCSRSVSSLRVLGARFHGLLMSDVLFDMRLPPDCLINVRAKRLIPLHARFRIRIRRGYTEVRTISDNHEHTHAQNQSASESKYISTINSNSDLDVANSVVSWNELSSRQGGAH